MSTILLVLLGMAGGVLLFYVLAWLLFKLLALVGNGRR